MKRSFGGFLVAVAVCRYRQWECHQTKGFMSKTTVVHVDYNSWYISLAYLAKQEREMTKCCVVHSELSTSIAYLAWARFC